MRIWWPAAALFAAGGVLWPAADEYPQRRAALAAALEHGAVVVFAAGEESAGAGRTGFRQDTNFYYLSGWEEPGAALLIGPQTDILFLPKPETRRETYHGRMLDPADPGAAAATGFRTVLPLARLEGELGRVLENSRRIYTVGEEATVRLRRAFPLREVASAGEALARLRMTKSPAEIASLRRAAEASMEAHRAAWRRAAPGVYEYQVAAALAHSWLEAGCERAAFAPIVASGPNAVVLHYEKNRRRMEAGELLLIDAGAECAAYAADVTRTVPVSGRFSERQRKLYEAVLAAQQAAIAAVKPGARLADLTRAAREHLDANGGLGRYLTHRVSHHVGLDVHDPADLDAPLAENMVITVEPGVYIPEENLGIRIEDMVRVTKTGAEILTAALERAPEAIERAMERR